MTKQVNGMSRQEAEELYEDMRRTMAGMMKNHPEVGMNNGKTAAKKGGTPPQPQAAVAPRSFPAALPSSRINSGHRSAILLVIGIVGIKLMVAALEGAGIGKIETANAVMMTTSPSFVRNTQTFSKEEIQVLTSLDARRAELEERSKRIDNREQDLEARDREFAVRLTQLRELTNKLKVDREKDEKKQGEKIEQLANVYGSMNPPEAAALIQQLDMTIALELVQRMPEKRIAQILALMAPEKALMLTKMLSETVGMGRKE